MEGEQNDEIDSNDLSTVNRSLPSPSTMSEARPKFRFVKIDGRPSGGIGPPPETLLRRDLNVSKSSDVLGVDTMNFGSAPSIWNVKKVKPIPQDYKLARSSRFIANTEVSTVCSRIVNAIRKIGLRVKYDSEEAVARCETPYFVKMDIYLHSGKRDFSDGIIVEVKRTFGGCIEFMADCRTILNAAEGKNRSKSRLAPVKPIADMECLKNNIEISKNDTQHAKDALACSERCLQDDCADVKILGLKSIISILDRRNCSCPTVTLVYECVFTGSINPDINRSILSYLEKRFETEIDDEYKRKLHSLALDVVYNSLYASRTVCRDGMRKSLRENPWLTESLTPVLVRDLKNLNKNPRDALCSLKCLNEIIPMSMKVRNKVLEEGVFEAGEAANKMGQIYCEKMTNASEMLLRELSSTTI